MPKKCTLTCAQCGISFLRYPSQSGAFCSKRCANLAKRRPANAICATCSVPFFRSPSRLGPFCSRRCSAAAQSHLVNKTCETCGQQFQVQLCRINHAHFCSRKCRADAPYRRRNQGRMEDGEGYTRVPLSDGRYTLEHRVVAEQMMGRPLLPGEVVHHINEVKSDNQPSNLKVMSRADHRRFHAKNGRPDRWSRDHDCCVSCGTTAKRHVGHGLCSRCYFAARFQQAKQPLSAPALSDSQGQ